MSKVSQQEELKKFDELIYFVSEAPTELRDEGVVLRLFPEYSGTTFYEDVLSATFLEMYEYYRSIGMTRNDVAHKLGVSSRLMDDLFRGVGITVDTLVKLCRMELAALADFKQKHLKNLDEQVDAGKWQASVTVLELICPTEFGGGQDSEDAPPLEIMAYEDPTYEDVELPHAPQ